ncbi:MAG: alpha/beta hydrolase [Bacillota bacterium]|nr:alpha/beta hydrolase [Bacillota bacterium]
MPGLVKEGTIQVGGSDMHYVAFGKGTTPLVIIPGLGDGLRTVKGTGLLMWLIYRKYAREYRVWIFSRKNELEPGFTTREMAREQAEAMDKLNIQSAYIMGVSQGGMISQWLAVDHPQKVSKLVIVVSRSRQNETVQEVVGNWIKMAEQERYGELAIDTMEKAHTEKYLRKWRPFYWLVKRTGKPVSKERFLIQANSCLTHDAYGELDKIKCPTLVIGGGDDKIIGGPESQQEMADAIPHSRLILYPELGHGAYAEAKDFHTQVLDFLR